MRYVRVRLVSSLLFRRAVCVARLDFRAVGFAALALIAPLMALYGVFSLAPCPILVLHVRAVCGHCGACGGLLWRVRVLWCLYMCFCCSWRVAACAACGDGVRVAVSVSAFVSSFVAIAVYDFVPVYVAVSVYPSFSKMIIDSWHLIIDNWLLIRLLYINLKNDQIHTYIHT